MSLLYGTLLAYYIIHVCLNIDIILLFDSKHSSLIFDMTRGEENLKHFIFYWLHAEEQIIDARECNAF